MFVIWRDRTLQFVSEVKITVREFIWSRLPRDCTVSADCPLVIKHLIHSWQVCQGSMMFDILFTISSISVMSTSHAYFQGSVLSCEDFSGHVYLSPSCLHPVWCTVFISVFHSFFISEHSFQFKMLALFYINVWFFVLFETGFVALPES